jgi:hypothetical protein
MEEINTLSNNKKEEEKKTTKPKGKKSTKKGVAPEIICVSPTEILNEKSDVGRPSSYTKERATKLCYYLSIGQSLRTACSHDDMPSIQTVFTWFNTFPEFLEQYTRAKQEAADMMAEDILDIADDGRNDWMTVYFGKNEVTMPNREVLARSKLRVDARIFLMSKMKPRKYGDKPEDTTPKTEHKANAIVFKDFSEEENATSK